MTAFLCDRCKKYYENPAQYIKYYVATARADLNTTIPRFDYEPKDLCPNCSIELKQWMDNYKEEIEK